MTKIPPLAVSPRGASQSVRHAILSNLLALALTSVALGPAVEAQTNSGWRRAGNASRRPSANQVAPQGEWPASLAAYVSDYIGAEEIAAPPAQPKTERPAPSSPPALSFEPAPPSAQGAAKAPLTPAPYEEIGPGIPAPNMPGQVAVAEPCDSCGAMDGCACDEGPWWGPGDCYGGECCPLLGPLLRPLHDRVWLRSDYLLWWLDGQHAPPLVTTSTDANDAGILGRATTRILFPEGDLNGDSRSGARFTLGTRLGPCDCVAFEVTYAFVGQESTTYGSGSVTDTVLARPFFDAGSAEQGGGVPSSWLLASPGQLQGFINVDSSNEFFTLEALVRRRLYADCNRRLDLVTGYRHASLRDKLRIDDHRQAALVGGRVIDQHDFFDADNAFNGAQIGFIGRINRCNWTLEALLKVALGSTRSDLTINGSTTDTVGGQTTVTRGGLLAQPTNMGDFRHTSFAMLPELGLTIGYDFTCRLRGTIGYSLLYWSKVIRAADQIDTDVNLPTTPGQLPAGAQLPRMSFTTNDFWAQGLSFGLDYSF